MSVGMHKQIARKVRELCKRADQCLHLAGLALRSNDEHGWRAKVLEATAVWLHAVRVYDGKAKPDDEAELHYTMQMIGTACAHERHVRLPRPAIAGSDGAFASSSDLG